MFKVAIVGRPNVGKSTLFNRLCGIRRSIVGDEPGITRDRIFGTAAWRGKTIEFTDTGGMLPDSKEAMPGKILQQVERAIGDSRLLLLVVDGRAGVTPLDEQLLPMLRRTSKPFWVIVNKIDVPDMEALAAPFYAFGAGEVFPVSAEHGRGLGDLLDALHERMDAEPSDTGETEPAEEITIAVVGRPNVGKSSLVNRLLGEERTIVSEIPGTTRDAVDTILVREDTRYRLIDTAGIRRKGRTDQRTEKVSVVLARRSMKRASIALLLLDAVEGVTKLDAAIGGYASESGCSAIIVLNKWDRIEKDLHTLEKYTADIRRRMKYLAYAPILTVSALTGMRVSKLFEMVNRAHAARSLRVPTGELNNLFVPDMTTTWQTRRTAQKLDLRYMTQVSSNPPTFVVFSAGRKPLHFSSERFLINRLRERYEFYAAPIRIQQKFKAPHK
jgi:GTP-binding protein